VSSPFASLPAAARPVGKIACPQRCRTKLHPANAADTQNRHSYYVLSDKSSISDERIKEVVEQSVKHAPSSFNMQSSRVVVVTGQKNKDLWKLVGETYAKVLGDDRELPDPYSTPDSCPPPLTAVTCMPLRPPIASHAWPHM